MILYYEAWSMLFSLLLSFVTGMTIFVLIVQGKFTGARLWQLIQWQVTGAAANGAAALLYADMFHRGPAGWVAGVLLIFMACMLSFLYMTRMWSMA